MPAHEFDEWETEWHVRFFHHHQQQLRQRTGDPRRILDCATVSDALDDAFDVFDSWRGRGCPLPLPPELEGDAVFHLVVELAVYALDREEAPT
jgi:hypothetical protein